MKSILLVSLVLVAAISSQAAEIPKPSEKDPRIRFVSYKSDEVTTLNVRRGTVTRIVLGRDEKVIKSASGFQVSCDKNNDDFEWCIDVVENEVWVKPLDNATFNNLEVKTNKHDYSFEFHVLADSPEWRGSKSLATEPFYRVAFKYPDEQALLSSTGKPPAKTQDQIIKDLTESSIPLPRNWNYSMQPLEGSDDIVPSLVFDDGRFTYFKFPENREIPAIFYLSQNDEEGRINFHMEGDLAVVQRLSRKFVLRLGTSVVGIFNDSFDANGVAPKDGTTVNGIKRVIK